jgi:chemotaxis signal transduction protein
VQKLLCFQAGGQTFGAPIRAIKETLPERPLTRVFLVPDLVAGLMNLRGEVVAVLDLPRMLGLKPAERTHGRPSDAAIVILRGLEAQGSARAARAACGLWVERLDGVRDVPDEAIKPPPATLDPSTAQFLSAIAASDPNQTGLPRPVLILDPERILGCETLRPYRREARA